MLAFKRSNKLCRPSIQLTFFCFWNNKVYKFKFFGVRFEYEKKKMYVLNQRCSNTEILAQVIYSYIKQYIVRYKTSGHFLVYKIYQVYIKPTLNLLHFQQENYLILIMKIKYIITLHLQIKTLHFFFRWAN